MASIKETNRGMCGDGFTTFTRQQLADHEAYVKKMRAAGAENFEAIEETKKDPEQFLLPIGEDEVNDSAEMWKVLMEHMKRMNKIEDDLIRHVKNLEKEVTDLKNRIYVLENPKPKPTWGEWFSDLWKSMRNKFTPKKETILERLIREDKQ
jgi:hypothetical protein